MSNNNFIATCTFAGWNTSKYDAQGRIILRQEPFKINPNQPTAVDDNKKNVDFLIIAVGSKPEINWKGGKIERLKSRKALEKLQRNYTWATDF